MGSGGEVAWILFFFLNFPREFLNSPKFPRFFSKILWIKSICINISFMKKFLVKNIINNERE